MENDTRPAIIREALELGKRDIELEKDLDTLDYNYRNARSSILNELSRIRMRLGELIRTEGINVARVKGSEYDTGTTTGRSRTTNG